MSDVEHDHEFIPGDRNVCAMCGAAHGPDTDDVFDVARRTDWSEFASQKTRLVGVIDARKDELLEGLLNWIDAIQDALARELGEEFIFPHLHDDDEEDAPDDA